MVPIKERFNIFTLLISKTLLPKLESGDYPFEVDMALMEMTDALEDSTNIHDSAMRLWSGLSTLQKHTPTITESLSDYVSVALQFCVESAPDVPTIELIAILAALRDQQDILKDLASKALNLAPPSQPSPNDDDLIAACKDICRTYAPQRHLSTDEKNDKAEADILAKFGQHASICFSDHGESGHHTAMYMGMISSPTTGNTLSF